MSLWRNPVPSSTRFCRPIKITYEKESSELIQRERDNIEKQINELKKTVIKLINDEIEVEVRISYELRLTMVDGKAVNAVSNNSSPRVCNICQAKPIQMNNKETILGLEVNIDSLHYGLSALHAYIRCFECILHICYRLPIKRWDIRGEEARKKCEKIKQRVQTEFWKKLGLLVDFPKDGGSGKFDKQN